MERIKDFVLNKEWAVVMSVLIGSVTALETQVSVLPDGDAKSVILAAIIAAGGFLTRLRVWSNKAVDIVKAGG